MVDSVNCDDPFDTLDADGLCPTFDSGNPFVNPVTPVPPYADCGDVCGTGLIKSIIIDCADGYSNPADVPFIYLGLRMVELYYLGSPIAMVGGAGYATSYYDASRVPYYGFTGDLTGDDAWNGWMGERGLVTNQRLIGVFPDLKIADSVVINNFHGSGGSTDWGAKNIKIYITDDVYTNIVYAAAISGNSTLIYEGVLAEHVANDVADPQAFSIPAYNPFGVAVADPYADCNDTCATFDLTNPYNFTCTDDPVVDLFVCEYIQNTSLIYAVDSSDLSLTDTMSLDANERKVTNYESSLSHGDYLFIPLRSPTNRIVRVNMRTFTRVDFLDLSETSYYAMDHSVKDSNGYGYFITHDTGPTRSIMYKVDLVNFVEVSKVTGTYVGIASLMLAEGYDPSFLFMAAGKYNLSTLSKLFAFTGATQLMGIANSAGTLAYYATSVAVASVTKVIIGAEDENAVASTVISTPSGVPGRIVIPDSNRTFALWGMDQLGTGMVRKFSFNTESWTDYIEIPNFTGIKAGLMVGDYTYFTNALQISKISNTPMVHQYQGSLPGYVSAIHRIETI